MLSVRRPSDAEIDTFLRSQKNAALSYVAVGATAGAPPSDYNIDHNRVQLGSGEAACDRAIAALRKWEMFNVGWVSLCWPHTPIEPACEIAILVRLYGLWSLNACRIVYVVDEDAGVRRFGFAYGTLQGHPASGEESFVVTRDNDGVHVTVRAYSHAGTWYTHLGGPVTRLAQPYTAHQYATALRRLSSP